MKRKLLPFAAVLAALLLLLSAIPCTAENPHGAETESNNTWETANRIAPDVPVTGILSNEEDIDCYCFEANADGFLDILFAHEEEENAAWEILLYRIRDDIEIVSSFETGKEDAGISSWRTGIDAGSYIIWISGATESSDDVYGKIYQLTFSLTENAYWESAGSGKPTEAKRMEFGAVYGGTVSGYGDNDYFKLVVPQNGYLEILFEHELTASARWSIALYQGEACLDEVYSWESYGTETSSKSLKIAADSGVYFIRISRGAVSYSGIYGKTYKISAQFTANDFWENTWNQSFVHARTILIGENYSGNLSNSSDLDYYVLEVERAVRLQLRMSSPEISSSENADSSDGATRGWQISLCRFDKTMQNLFTRSVAYGENQNDEFWCSVPPGTYYILVKNIPQGDKSICGETYSFLIESAFLFADVPQDAWYRPYVEYTAERGLFLGTGDGIFSPDTPMTRAMFVQLFANLDGADLSQYTHQPFSDVDMSAWYGSAVAWASEHQIVLGTSAATFAPTLEITREQMCQMIVNYIRYAGIDLYISDRYVPFADEDSVSEWAKEAVEICARAGLISGRGNGCFDPKGTASRAEVATLLTNFCKKISS